MLPLLLVYSLSLSYKADVGEGLALGIYSLTISRVAGTHTLHTACPAL